MAYGDIYYEIFNAGSVAASANTPHLLFSSTGLSDLNDRDVVEINLVAPGGVEYNIGLTGAVGDSIGETVFAGGSGERQLRPMKVGEASRLHFSNTALGSNASPAFVIWRKVP